MHGWQCDVTPVWAGLAWSRRRDAFTSEEHRGSAERDVISAHTTSRWHQPDSGEDHFTWELPQQPPWTAARQLSHGTGPSGRDERAVQAGQRWRVRTLANPRRGYCNLIVIIIIIDRFSVAQITSIIPRMESYCLCPSYCLEWDNALVGLSHGCSHMGPNEPPYRLHDRWPAWNKTLYEFI